MPSATFGLLGALPTAPVSLTPGSGPLLAVHECNQCEEAHPNPNFLAYTDVPPEIVEGILGNVSDPLEIHRLSRLCTKFKALAIYVLHGRLLKVLNSFDLSDNQEFVRILRHHGVYWAGPCLLPVLFPDVVSPASNRMELHVQNRPQALTALEGLLHASGYGSSQLYEGQRRMESFATESLGYPHFGQTLKRITRLTKQVNGVLKEVVLFVSRSELSGFLSITEYPTTLLMVYTDGINFHVLYPYLTGHRRGLVNLPFPRRPAPSSLPPLLQSLLPTFDLKDHLTEWPEYLFHVCEQNSYCPLRLRHQLNNRALSLGCSVDHPDLRPFRQRALNRILISQFIRPKTTLCIWRLRCCAGCLANMPFPEQGLSYASVYITADMFIVEQQSV